MIKGAIYQLTTKGRTKSDIHYKRLTLKNRYKASETDNLGKERESFYWVCAANEYTVTDDLAKISKDITYIRLKEEELFSEIEDRFYKLDPEYLKELEWLYYIFYL